MNGKLRLILVVSLGVVLLASGTGVTGSSFVDPGSSTGNAFQAWASTPWVQTTQADFEAGVLNSVDTSSSPGNVKLTTISDSDTVTDTFSDETKIASKSNVVVSVGQVKLTATGGGTETLRPNAAGTYSQCDPVGGFANYQCVDEAVADEDSTYVRTWLGATELDTYNIADHSQGTGAINSVTVYIRTRATSGTHAVEVAIRTYSMNYFGSYTSPLPTSYTYISATWTKNPNTNNDWTWAEIDALQAGVRQYDLDTGYLQTTQVYVEVDYTAYNSPGTLTSVNLLSGETVDSIDSFGYNASAIPSGTGLKVQFSQDSTNWYNSAGTASGWDTLSQGTHSIDLSGLGWSGANFYYKMEFTSDGTDTPVLDEISVTFTGGNWYDTDWSYCREITIDHTKVEDVADPSTTYADFPVLVYATGLSNIKAAGADIRFTSSDGTTELPREIEDYSGGTLYAWVKVTLTKDSSDADDDVIYMYYGNAAATEPAPDSAYGSQNVWDDNYNGVWHLSEDPSGTAPQMKDSTSNNNDGSSQGSMTAGNQVTGQIDGSLDFDGSNHYIQTTSSELKTADAITISVWFKADVTTGAHHIVWEGKGTENGWGAGATGHHEMHINVGAYDQDNILGCFYGTNEDAAAPNVIRIDTAFSDTANFHYAVFVVTNPGSSPAGELFLDGVSKGTDTGDQTGRADWDTNLRIGRPGADQRYFDGMVDEVRISNTARSADWIETCYNNQSSPSTFHSVGSEQQKTYVSPPTLVGSWSGETDFETNGFNYTPGAGSNRVALVTITAESNSTPVANINQVTLGGQALTAIENADGVVVGSAGFWHDLIWFGYLNETGIGNMSGNALNITWDTAPTNSPPIMIQAATYQNVDQTTPIADSASSTNTAAGFIQAGSVSVGSNDRLVYVTVCGQPSDHTAPGGYTEQVEQDGGPVASHSNASVQRDATTSSTENPTATWSGTNRLAIISAVLNAAANESSYTSPGTIASQVLNTGADGARWDALFWDETLPSNTDITFKARASNTPFAKDAASPPWIPVGGDSPVISGLPSGRYIQWQATLTTSDPSQTPTLHEVRVYYSDY